MIENRPPSMTYSQPVNHALTWTARKTLCEEGRTFCTLLRVRCCPSEEPSLADVHQLCSNGLADLIVCCMATGEKDLVRRWSGTAKLSHGLHPTFDVRFDGD
jgi:hypothetical protein